METLLHTLGWCTLINFGLLAITAFAILCFGQRLKRLHSRMFNMEESQLQIEYFRYLAQYKILVIVFNLVPYLALRIVLS